LETTRTCEERLSIPSGVVDVILAKKPSIRVAAIVGNSNVPNGADRNWNGKRVPTRLASMQTSTAECCADFSA
jgi:hypothetical protein